MGGYPDHPKHIISSAKFSCVHGTHGLNPNASNANTEPAPKSPEEWILVRRRRRKQRPRGSSRSNRPERKEDDVPRPERTIRHRVLAKPPFLGVPDHTCEVDRHSIARRRDAKKAAVVKTKAGKGRRPRKGRNTSGKAGVAKSTAVFRPKNASNGIRFGEAEHPGHDTPNAHRSRRS